MAPIKKSRAKTAAKRSSPSRKSTTTVVIGPRQRSTKKRKTRKKNSQNLKRVAWGMLILIAMVVTIAMVLHVYLRPQLADSLSPQKKSTRSKVITAKPTDQKNRATKAPQKKVKKTIPPFEIFTQNGVSTALPEKPPLDPNKLQPDKRIFVSIIIDDIGYDVAKARKFINLVPGLTLSVIPYSPHQKRIIQMAADQNVDVMLHMPMEPIEYPRIDPGPGALLSTMPTDTLISQLNKNLDTAVRVKGINNHMGSKLTENPEQMHKIFSILKKRNLFFVDSRTTKRSYARSAAKLFRVPFAERSVFLDHHQDKAFVKKQLRQLVRYAKKHGAGIGIGHPYKVTYQTFQEVLPKLQKEVTFVPVNQLVQIEE